MIQHYLKIAVRNLWKYKVQSAICIVGLAVGFVCFALSALWIHYETTYDSSYEGADRMYLVYRKDVLFSSGVASMPYQSATLLKREFPEVEATCAFQWIPEWEVCTEEGRTLDKEATLVADSCFMNLFGLSVLKGSRDFLVSSDKVALTEECAMQLFGTTDVLGEKLKLKRRDDREVTVCAIVSALKGHSSFAYGFWYNDFNNPWRDEWGNWMFKVVVKLREGTDLEKFQQKFDRYVGRLTDGEVKKGLEGCRFMPLHRYHSSPLDGRQVIRFHYLVLFAVVGGLVILCSLFNYLVLFVNRMRMRGREIELRKVCGSSRWRLFLLFAVEYVLLLCLAGLVGMVLIEVSLPVFRELSGVEGGVYAPSLLYFVGLVLLSLVCLLPFVRYRAVAHVSRFDSFRKISVFMQFAISILFVFCVCVLLKQVWHLRHTDIGWERENIAAFRYIYPMNQFDEIVGKVGQLPYVHEVLSRHIGLFPPCIRMGDRMEDWSGKQASDQPFDVEIIPEGEEFVRFYGIRLLEGTFPKEGTQEVLVSEAMVKACGMHDPIGKAVYVRQQWYTLAGVVKDFQTSPPTVPGNPIIFTGVNEDLARGVNYVALKYQVGEKEALYRAVSKLMEAYPDVRYEFVVMSDEYDSYLKAELVLLKLLVFVSVVCMVVSLFGIYSLVTLACRQRRKEIAVRKINGATVSDILLIFVKEYFLLLTSAALVAFLIGYILMKHWLEQYVEQTEISVWLFLLIYIGMALVVCLSIGSRVWEAVRQNPAEVIKEMN